MTDLVYDVDGIQLWHGDHRDVLPTVAATAHLAMVDAPYGDTALPWDRLTTDWLSSIDEACAPTAAAWVWGSMRYLWRAGPAAEAAGWTYSQDTVWEKHNGSGSAADRFRRVHEHTALVYRGPWADLPIDPQYSADATARQVRRKQRPMHWGEIGESAYQTEDGGPRLMRSVMFERSAHGSALHPTQKPEGITRSLIQYACPPGGLVVVPYAGSATDLVAARAAGRRAVGVELDAKYIERALRRLNAPGLPFATEATA